MKGLYLTLSIIFTVLVLILSFENISAQCTNLNLLFFPIRSNPTIILMGTAVLGVITGILYHAFLTKVFETSPEDEDEQF